MIVAIFKNAGSALTMVSSSRCGWRQWFASGAAILAILIFAPMMELPMSFASAQTQMQLNKEACDEYKKADAELNDVYRRINRNYRDDPGFTAALKKAQLAWISYRDAHLESIFPGDAGQYGSVNPMCRCTILSEITKERLQVLKRWIEGVEEGDVCAGSVRAK